MAKAVTPAAICLLQPISINRGRRVVTGIRSGNLGTPVTPALMIPIIGTTQRRNRRLPRRNVKDYLVAVQKGRRHAATHRYIAVETLRTTKKQLADYLKKRAEAKSAAGGTELSSRWVEPDQLRCMMVFDTQSKQFVGSGCYVICSLPPVETIPKFDHARTEYVGTSPI